MSTQQVKNYIDESVVEEVYAGLTSIPLNTTTPLRVVGGQIGSNYDGVIVSIAANQNNNITLWIKKQDKQVRENGYASAALPAALAECPVYMDILEKDTWELGITNTSGGAIVVAWLIRIRTFLKE